MLLKNLHVPEMPLETGAMAIFPWNDALAARFSLVNTYGEPFLMFRRQGRYIELPREVAPLAYRDTRAEGLPVSFTVIKGPRNPEQHRVVAEMIAFLGRGESGIVQAPTGTGKTYFGTRAMAAVGRKTLVLVPKEDLLSQWRDSFKQFLGLKNHEIGHLQADTVNVSGKKVVLAMIHSVALRDRYDPSVFADFGLVIVDETHRAAADQLSNAFVNLPARLRLGLSATPKRKDGKDQVIFAHIGPIRVVSEAMALTPRVMVFETGWKLPLVPRKKAGRTVLVPLPMAPGRTTAAVVAMAKSDGRNALIGRLTRMALTKERRIVIFTDILDHVEALVAACRVAGVPHGQIARYVGGMTEAARASAKTFPVLVATWGMFKEGTDIPALDTVILASPKSDVVQGVGRILRICEGKKEPLVIDLVDQAPVFHGYYRARAKWYASIGASVKHIT